MYETVEAISPGSRDIKQVEALLHQEGIRLDGNLDYTCGIFDEDGSLIATGSCFENTLRCLAVSSRHQGEGLLNQVISHLTDFQAARGNFRLFLYTKPASAKFMSDLGFYEIARVPGKLVFMENRRTGFTDYCTRLAQTRREGERIAAVVMNANPFTLGHRHLVERAAWENDVVHLFILSQEAGPIPFRVRRQLVHAGVADLPNVICHDSDAYIISSATFPSYFLKDEEEVVRTQAALDLAVFGKIADALGIQRRYVGEEPTSRTTCLYNEVMARAMPEMGMECRVVPRVEADSRIISASTVRQAIHDGQLESVRDMLPESTYRYFAGPEGAQTVAALKAAHDLIHH